MSLRQQASHTDQLLRQMRSEVDDLTTALEARDSQNQVLRRCKEQKNLSGRERWVGDVTEEE